MDAPSVTPHPAATDDAAVNKATVVPSHMGDVSHNVGIFTKSHPRLEGRASWERCVRAPEAGESEFASN